MSLLLAMGLLLPGTSVPRVELNSSQLVVRTPLPFKSLPEARVEVDLVGAAASAAGVGPGYRLLRLGADVVKPHASAYLDANSVDPLVPAADFAIAHWAPRGEVIDGILGVNQGGDQPRTLSPQEFENLFHVQPSQTLKLSTPMYQRRGRAWAALKRQFEGLLHETLPWDSLIR